MPDALLWLGVKKIDRFISMSDMKYDALANVGIEVTDISPSSGGTYGGQTVTISGRGFAPVTSPSDTVNVFKYLNGGAGVESTRTTVYIGGDIVTGAQGQSGAGAASAVNSDSRMCPRRRAFLTRCEELFSTLSI